MTAEQEQKLEAMLDVIRRTLALDAELAGLSFPHPRVMPIIQEQEALKAEMPQGTSPANVECLFWCDEGTLHSLYCSGHVGPWEFALGAMDALAAQAVSEADTRLFSVDFQFTARKLISLFGTDAAARLGECIEAVLRGARLLHHHWYYAGHEDKPEAMAAIDDPELSKVLDEGWSLVEVDPSAATARPTTYFDCDEMGGFAELVELIEKRDRAARKILRGEVA